MRSGQPFSYLALDPEETRSLNPAYHGRIYRDQSKLIPLDGVEAGTGVAVALEAFGYSFGNRVKLVRLTPEPKPISFGNRNILRFRRQILPKLGD